MEIESTLSHAAAGDEALLALSTSTTAPPGLPGWLGEPGVLNSNLTIEPPMIGASDISFMLKPTLACTNLGSKKRSYFNYVFC